MLCNTAKSDTLMINMIITDDSDFLPQTPNISGGKRMIDTYSHEEKKIHCL